MFFLQSKTEKNKKNLLKKDNSDPFLRIDLHVY